MDERRVRQIGTPDRGLRRPGRHVRRHVPRLAAHEPPRARRTRRRVPAGALRAGRRRDRRRDAVVFRFRCELTEYLGSERIAVRRARGRLRLGQRGRLRAMPSWQLRAGARRRRRRGGRARPCPLLRRRDGSPDRAGPPRMTRPLGDARNDPRWLGAAMLAAGRSLYVVAARRAARPARLLLRGQRRAVGVETTTHFVGLTNFRSVLENPGLPARAAATRSSSPSARRPSSIAGATLLALA